MELFFAPREKIGASTIELDSFEQQHLIQVLRKTRGSEVLVTDGEGRLYKTRLVSSKSPVMLEIIDYEERPAPSVSVELIIGYIRPNRLEWVLEKGTELGISVFHLTRTRYANFKSDNEQRFQRIVRQAIKQSNRLYLPRITFNQDLTQALEKIEPGGLCYAAVDAAYPPLIQELKRLQERHNAITLAIGPEGGWHEQEVALLKAHDCLPVSLGDYRLRTETAAISGIAIIQQYIHK